MAAVEVGETVEAEAASITRVPAGSVRENFRCGRDRQRAVIEFAQGDHEAYVSEALYRFLGRAFVEPEADAREARAAVLRQLAASVNRASTEYRRPAN